uniref:Uncharacterized protein n=1 Tax=Amphiprion percula TaxID=161767 RepID=A0A3P8SRB8_AMPPE
MPNQVQKEALILEPGHEELNKKESITLPMSDTLSSADSLYENEAHQKMKDIPEQYPEQEQVPKPEQNPELEQDPKPEQSPEFIPTNPPQCKESHSTAICHTHETEQ